MSVAEKINSEIIQTEKNEFVQPKKMSESQTGAEKFKNIKIFEFFEIFKNFEILNFVNIKNDPRDMLNNFCFHV